MRAPLYSLAAALALFGCKNDERSGLPPASEWHRPTEAPQPEPDDEGPSGEMPDDDIHGGMGGGGRGDLGPASGEMPDDEIHGGMGGGGGGSGGAMPPGHGGAVEAPGPVDPNKVLEGTLAAGPAAAKAIKPGMVLYLSLKPVGTQDCVVKGVIPAASQRVNSPTLPFSFKITEADARTMGGSTISGEYLLCAHMSTTGDASDKVAGDAFASAKVKVPQKGIKLTLDTVLP